MESSGQCEWELASVVDNTQRGSVERMVEKMRCMTELKVQPTSESEMTRMERQELEAERDRARAEKQAAEDRVREMEGRVREMEGRVRERAREEKGAAEYRVREMEDIVGQMEGAMEGERDRVREMEGKVREMEGERDGGEGGIAASSGKSYRAGEEAEWGGGKGARETGGSRTSHRSRAARSIMGGGGRRIGSDGRRTWLWWLG